MVLVRNRPVVSLCSESQALASRFTTRQTPQRLYVIDRAIRRLKDAGIWARLDCLWFMAAADSQAARLNWVSSSFTLTAVNSPTFTANQGYTGDGVSAYVDTNYTADTDGVKYLQNDASAGIYVRSIGALRWWGVNGAGGDRYINTGDASGSDLVNIRLNCASTQNVGPAVGALSTGLKAVDRSSSSAMSMYDRGALAVSGASTSDGRPQSKLFLLCRSFANTPLNFGTGQLSMCWLGGSLTAPQHAAMKTISDEYLSAIGTI